MIVVLMDFGAGMARLRSVAICFTGFFVSSRNEIDRIVGFGSAKIYIIYVID